MLIEILIETVPNSFYLGFARENKSLSIKILLDQLDVTLSSLAKVKLAIEDILSPSNSSGSFPGKNLLFIDGLGKNTVANFLAVVAEKGQFRIASSMKRPVNPLFQLRFLSKRFYPIHLFVLVAHD
ncbi:MAG: hypothetical protein NC905_01140, partial [Candidatus Omnitrophica bacterium]|nr:hypothetical protein [Candidatus Omnitrophota bacterium]